MRALENLDGTTWKEFLEAPTAVLMLGKSDCEACKAWTAELEAFLASDARWPDVRFGKILLDQRGLIDFKRANPWLGEVKDLPYTAIYVNGERGKSFVGGGMDRLATRLSKVVG